MCVHIDMLRDGCRTVNYLQTKSCGIQTVQTLSHIPGRILLIKIEWNLIQIHISSQIVYLSGE